ncbi:MFS general substrate transporter [Chiua virens]|nr:MFS general substrate transporter [Chiua virens]
MQTTGVSTEGYGANPRHPAVIRPSNDQHQRHLPNLKIGVSDDIELNDVSQRKPRPSPDGTDNALVIPQTKGQRLRERVQFATLCWTLYLAGWNDGTTGPLLPRIQKVYGVNFAVVSLIFVFACIGFLTGAFSNVVLNDRYGFGKVIVLGSVLQMIGYCIEGAALPFPAFVLGYAINGIGLALQDAQANGFVASLKDNAEAKMGFLHAVRRAGALSSPLAATQFAQLPHWSFHYLVSLGIASINTVLLIVVFRLKSQDGAFIDHPTPRMRRSLVRQECLTQIGQPAGERGENENSHFRQILSLKDVHLLAVFILVYVGVEVTLGGSWIVTYIIDVRGGGPSSGYISSGFFGGLMTGRVVLLWLNQKVGERRVLFIYALLAIGLELVVWLVPSLISDAVVISIVGVLLGPMYPITMNHAGRVLPAWLLTGSIGWIAGFGQAGSALFPFITGTIASKTGISSLQPLLVAMMVFMTVLWALVPSKGSRRMD